MTVGRQVAVFTHPDDVARLADELDAVHGARLLPWWWATEAPPAEAPAATDVFTFVAAKNDVGRIRPRHIAARDHWLPDTVVDPGVEWRRSTGSEGTLTVGRFVHTPVTSEGVPKDADFVAFAARLHRWLKRHLATVEVDGRRVSCTPTVRDAVAAGTLALSMNPASRRPPRAAETS